MRSDERYYRIPLVLLSLFGAEHDIAEFEHRPNATGLKPIRAAHLANLIEQALTGKTSQTSEIHAAPQALPTFRGSKILLVEDNPVNQRVAQRTLQKLAAEVTIANNGAEALERIRATDFDAVLMDCQMPVMDGFTATQRIRDMEAEQGAKAALGGRSAAAAETEKDHRIRQLERTLGRKALEIEILKNVVGE